MGARNVSDDLSTIGFFGKKPIIGLILFIIGILIFIVLAFNLVMNGPLLKWDLPIAEYFHTIALNSSSLMINFMLAGYYIGLQGVVAIGIILGLYFIYKRFWKELVMVTVAFGGGGLLFLFLSNILMRPRPFLLFDKLIWASSPNIPGFPSGHTLSAVVCFGFLAYLLVPKIKSYLGKTLVIMISLLIMFYIGFGRLYVGDHYLTDIIAGYAVGIAWFSLAFTSIELLFQKYKKEKNGYNKK